MAKALKIVGLVVAAVGIGLATAGFGAVAFTGAITATISTTAIIGAGLALEVGSQLLTKKGSTAPSQTDRLTTSLDPRSARKTWLGSTAGANDLRYEEWFGPNQDYCGWIVALASHRIEGLDAVYINQDLAWTAGGGVASKYQGYFLVQHVVLEGSPTNTVQISTPDARKWNASHRLTGCAYAHIQFRVTGVNSKATSPFSGGLPTRLTFIGRGGMVYDPRRDDTVPGGSGPMRAGDQATWRYTADDGAVIGANIPLQILRVLLGWRITNPTTGTTKLAVGCGLPPRRIDLGSFLTAAAIADEMANRSVGGVEPKFHGGAVLSESDDAHAHLDMLCAACNGRLRDVNGKLALVIMHNDLAGAATDDGLTDDDVLGGFSWDSDPPLDQCVNIVRGKYTDPSTASLYQMIDYPEVSLPSPDGIDRTMTLDLSVVQSPSHAQRIAKQVLERRQYQRTFTAPFDIRAWKYQVGDVVPFTFSALSFDRRLFRVSAQELGQDGQCVMSLMDENAAIYAWDADDAPAVVAADPIAYDPTKSPLVLAIGEAALSADWSQVVGDGKPQDNATRNVPRGAWSPDIGYSQGDIVTYGGSSYIAGAAVPAGTYPTNVLYWDALASGGAAGPKGADGISPAFVDVTATGYTVRYDTNGNIIGGQTITLTASRKNTTADPVWSILDGNGAEIYAKSAAAMVADSPAYYSSTGPDNITLSTQLLANTIGFYGYTAGRFSMGVRLSDRSGSSYVSIQKVQDGAAGPAGVNGAPGAPGSGGQTSYTHFAWADSADGTINFHTGAPAGSGYIGIYSDFTAAPSTSPAAYTWTLYAGPAAFGLEPHGGVYLRSNAVEKTGNQGWDAGASSTEGWKGGAQATFRGRNAYGSMAAGLNSDPETNSAFDTIDYGWLLTGGGPGNTGSIPLLGGNGLSDHTGGAWDENTVFQVLYDNRRVRWLKDGAEVFSLAATADQTLWFDSSIFYPNSGLQGISFGAVGSSGTDGATGAPGATGPSGPQGVPGAPAANGSSAYTHFAYANAADGSQDFVTGLANPGRVYIGLYTDTTPAGSTDYRSYYWSRLTGQDGLNGANGTPGPIGPNGQQSYVHFAYANSPDGRTDFTTGAPGSRTYIGVYSDYTQPDSGDPAAYHWSLIKGADGAIGAPGAAGTNGTNGVDGLATLNIRPVGAATWDGHNLICTSAANSWTGNGAYSANVIPGGVAVAFQRPDWYGTQEDAFFGLCTQPTPAIDYPKIDFSWRMWAGSNNDFHADTWNGSAGRVSTGWNGSYTYSIRYDDRTGIVTWYRTAPDGTTEAIDSMSIGSGRSFGLMATASRYMSIANVAFTAAGGTGATGSAGSPGSPGSPGAPGTAGPPGQAGVSPSPSYPALAVTGAGTFTYGSPVPLTSGQTLTGTAYINASVGNASATVTLQVQYSVDGGTSWNALATDQESIDPNSGVSLQAQGQYTNQSGGRILVYLRAVLSRNGASPSFQGGYLQPS